MSKVDEDITNQVSDVPPKKRKAQEDKGNLWFQLLSIRNYE